MLTRKQAVEGLRYIMQCGLFAEDVYEMLDNIIDCLEAEDELGFDIWGVKNFDPDYFALFCKSRELDEETIERLRTKYHHSNRWSGECGKGGES